MEQKTGQDGPRNLKLLIDGDGLVFAAGFAAEKAKWRIKFGYDEGLEDWCMSADFDYKKDLDQFVKEQEFEDGEYEVETWRQVEPVENALANARNMLRTICDSLHSDRIEFYLTGKDNFRYDIATIQPYKGNRVNVARPTHEAAIREYFTRVWDAITIDGQEADDAVSIRQMQFGDQSCIVSADKDLDMVPGWHSKIRNCELYYITEEEGMYNFYKQLLTGDPTDNIQGVPGIGKKKAEKILDGLETEDEMFQAVYQTYEQYHRARLEELEESLEPDELDQGVRAAIRENGRLLWMRRELDEMWELPDER